KAWRKNPAAMPLNELLQVATLNGAKALGIDSGVVEEGKLADLILIDKRSSAFIPDIDFLGNFVYSANSSCIDTMICNGKILMRGRKVEREDEILEASATMAYKLLKMK
ncbi:MAG: amidohydrolase family protein, partial [Bacteroidales bacterium]|nr:amidohydrolase family protein [Bacteroidales bacterium]